MLLEVLKKKMRVLKEELEAANEIADEYKIRVAEEIRRREEVSGLGDRLGRGRDLDSRPYKEPYAYGSVSYRWLCALHARHKYANASGICARQCNMRLFAAQHDTLAHNNTNATLIVG